MGYIAYFDIGGLIYKLPVNPERIDVSTVQAIEKYEVLKLGQIAVPTHMELMEISFETELPHAETHYSTIGDDFINSNVFLGRLKVIRESFTPIRFVYGTDADENGRISEREGESLLVLIESLEITEKAGEEGDKYVSFKLLEYREFSKKPATIAEITSFSVKVAKKKAVKEDTNPKSNGYHIVVSGDNLWKIAKTYYGDGSKSNIIFNANKDRIKSPGVISIGWKLKIPEKSEFSKYSAPLPNNSMSDERRKELETMAAELAKLNSLDNVAGIGSR